ncbi:MAG: YbfB/YjiJ family MFS transporter, partial [Lentimicrobiaceae bacterium]|nr:YbfB/YjiJ family MFS transporter [Lentimicrobiaceae bacterium]
CYFLAAVGIVPHSLFLSDYVHRDLGYSISDSSMLFSALGLGSAIGPVISGVLAKKLDTSMSLFFAYLTGVIAVLIILMFDEIELVALSAFLAGIFLISVVSLTSLRVLEIVGLEMHDHYWGILTLILASGWAIGSYSMSGLLSLKFQYINLFMTGQVVLALALGVYLFSWWRSKHI